jgi:3',5'-cyclic AMP phosphodiesterase CpdA
MPGEPLTDREDRWAYHFSHGNERIVILDARGSPEHDPQGDISPDQLERLDLLLRSKSNPISVFLHYPPIGLDSEWIDRTMLIRNGVALHNLLVSHRSRVRGIFFGHVHRSTCTIKDGILYASCGSPTMHFPNWPGSKSAVTCDDPIAFAQYIQISDDGVVVKPQWQLLQSPGTLL